jgi:hypothetical protein
MAFIAECPFCRLMLRGVPDERAGLSKECPRCHNLFTLAAMIAPRVQNLRKHRRAEGKDGEADLSSPLVSSVVDTPGAPEASLQNQIRSIYTDDEPARDPAGLATTETETTSSSTWPRRMAVASIAAGGLALLCALLPSFAIGLVPLIVIGTVLGVAALILARSQGPSEWVVPALGTAANLVAAVFGWFLPALFDPIPIGAYTPPALSSAAVEKIAISKGESAATAADKEWVDADLWELKHGPVRVRVTDVSVKPAKVKSEKGNEPTKDKYLQIELRLTNTSFDRGVQYEGWGAQAATSRDTVAHLADSLGKKIPLSFRPRTEIAGHVPWAWIPAGKEIKDLLVFDPPIGADHLDLELPASAYGFEGSLRFRIPKNMIHFQ